MATIKEISALTGLSLGTISNYLNGRKILPENAKIIEKAIKKLNYYPNNLGKFLRCGNTKTIGVVANDISAPYISNAISFLEEKLSEKGYKLFYCNSHNSLKNEQSHIKFLMSQSVNCILLFPVSYHKTDLSNLISSNIPFVICDSEPYPPNENVCSTVNHQNEQLAFDAVKLLIEQGHKEIACICGPKDHFSTETRLSGYLKALKKYNIPLNTDNIFYCNFDNELSYNATVTCLNKTTPVTACLITVNNMLVGFLRALSDCNKSVIKDVSYITFSHEPYYDILPVKPTYIWHDSNSIGKCVLEILEYIGFDKNTNKEIKPIKLFSDSKIILGDSHKKL